MTFNLDRRNVNEEDAMVAALLALHRRKQECTIYAQSDTSYRRILKHFEQRGERLRGERLVTAELIERLFQGSKALPIRRVERELEIIGPPGGRAAGRIRVTNRSSERARLELVIGSPLDGAHPPKVSFDRRQGELDPGEGGLFRVEANLLGWREGDSVTVPVECRWPRGKDRLWLVVSSRSSGLEGP
jgi:hypothetical protein